MAPPLTTLTLTKLDFLSLVDYPAQETASIRLIKRRDAGALVARIAKIGEGDDPLIWGWAFTCTDETGKPYADLQGDVVSPDFVKAAEMFMRQGGAVDEMHDGKAKSKVAFAFPMDHEIATALLGAEAGAATKISGLMVAVRPTPDQLAKARTGEYAGFSIAGSGIRELLKSMTCTSCGKYMGSTDLGCKSCGVGKATWSTADVDQLPDSSFLYIEPGGSKDDEGKTTPRSLRHFPYKNGTGVVDLSHLRDAIGRIPQSSLPKDKRDALQVKAERLLAAQHDAGKRKVTKQSVVTSEEEGHQHNIDLDDPSDEWRDLLATSWQTSAGASTSHAHAWTYDPITGAVTIAADSGHTHTVTAVVPADVMRAAVLNETGDRCLACGAMCEDDASYCSSCGYAMKAAPRTDLPPARQAPIVPVMAELDLLRKALALTDAHRAHVAKLAPDAQLAFLALDTGARDAAVSAAVAADPEVYKTRDGVSIRKSDGPVAERLARQADASAVELAKQGEELALAKAERERSALEKRATNVMSHFAKGRDVHVAVLRAIDGIADEATRKSAIEMLTAGNAALKEAGAPRGIEMAGHGGKGDGPEAQLNAMAKKYAADHGVTFAKAYVTVLETEAGAQLYNQTVS